MTVPLFRAEQEVSTSDDYYTPAWIFEELGIEFDFDVAAPPGGVPWIPAKRFYTIADDGLSQPWEGRVWMNPPYSSVTPWWQRFQTHRNGIALLPWVKSAWVVDMWNSNAVLALPHRWFNFDGQGSISYGVVFVGFGEWTREPLSRIGYVR